MTPQFQITSVQKRYGSSLALDLDTLTLWPRRLYVLTGPNGSGKSTLLNILSFLVKPDRGQIIFSDQAVTWSSQDLETLRKKVTLLHQHPYLFTGSVKSNVAYGLKMRGSSGDAVKSAIAESLAKVGLSGFEDRNVRHLSGGEARRVAFARALALKPEVLLLDEPLANVDKESRDVIEHLIVSLPENGTTVVMATHDLHHTELLKSTVIRLRDGKLDETAARASNDVPGAIGGLSYAHI